MGNNTLVLRSMVTLNALINQAAAETQTLLTTRVSSEHH